MQILFAGKAHPADEPGQELIQHIFQLSQADGFRGRVFFVEDYDMRVGRMLVQGVDVWLNTPRRPLEASRHVGHEGGDQRRAQLSIADGWWPEGYDGDNGWVIGTATRVGDARRAGPRGRPALYRLLEEEVVPAYYGRDEHGLPPRWIARMKRSIATIAPAFSSARMVRDYTEQAYVPLAARG